MTVGQLSFLIAASYIFLQPEVGGGGGGDEEGELTNQVFTGGQEEGELTNQVFTGGQAFTGRWSLCTIRNVCWIFAVDLI